MIGKILFTLAVILVVALIWRTRQPRQQQLVPQPRLVNPPPARRSTLRILALGVVSLMLLASDAFMQANYAQAIELWQKVMDLNSPRINRTQLVESINMAKLLQRRSD